MHYILPIDQILSRAAAIGLEHWQLAEEAGVARSTVVRAKRRGECRSQILKRLGEVLLTHERQTLARLRALHPEPQHEERAA